MFYIRLCDCPLDRAGNLLHLNFNPMVQTDISQFTRECNDWRETLRSYRDELHQMQTTLQQAVNHPLSKEEQTELEHLQNQLHIQLINVHDLKQAVKLHDRKLHSEVSGFNTGFSEKFLRTTKIYTKIINRLKIL